MPALLSIIIPTYQSAQYLGPTLVPLYKGLHDHLIHELIVCDASEDHATQTIANEVGARYFNTLKGRGSQLDYGAKQAKGIWLLFLHADTHLADNWSQVCTEHINTYPHQAGYFQLKYSAQGIFPFLTSAFANFRSKLFGLPYGDQGLLISRDLYNHIGGFPDIPLMEDVYIARKLKGRLRGLNCYAQTDAERKIKSGWIKSGVSNLILLTRYLMGTHPNKLYKDYYKSR